MPANDADRRMPPAREVDYILHDCLFAVGQAVGTGVQMEYEAVVWLRARYRRLFLCAMIQNGNSWALDRDRVTAVGRYLGQRAVHHSDGRGVIDVASVERAAADVERGCQMNARREAACTNSPIPAFSPQQPTAVLASGPSKSS